MREHKERPGYSADKKGDSSNRIAYLTLGFCVLFAVCFVIWLTLSMDYNLRLNVQSKLFSTTLELQKPKQ